MLENIAVIYEKRNEMMRKLKKKPYEANMAAFREEHGHYFDEMLEAVNAESDKDAAAREVARVLCDEVTKAYGKNGKIKGRVQADLNFFMIYYVFPAILLTDNESAEALCEGIKEVWGDSFKDSKIGYTTYQKLYDGFNEKILGLF